MIYLICYYVASSPPYARFTCDCSLDDEERVTTIGKAVSVLPLDPRMGRILLLGCIFGCAPSVLATAAAMGYKDPFLMPMNEQQRAAGNAAKARLSQGHPSDQIALLRAFEGLSTQKAHHFCDDNFLSISVMNYLKDLVQQLIQTLRESGVNPTQAYAQRNNGNMPLIMSIISIGLYPDIGVRYEGKAPFLLEKGRKSKIHPSSVNSKSPQFKGPCTTGMDLVGFQNLVSSPTAVPGGIGLMMLNTTIMSVFSLLLTCGIIKEMEEIEENSSDELGHNRTPSKKNNRIVVLEVDGWIKLKISSSSLALIKMCRATVSEAMEAFLSNPDTPLPLNLAKGADAIAQAQKCEQPSMSMSQDRNPVRSDRSRDQQYSRSESNSSSGNSGGRGRGRGRDFR